MKILRCMVCHHEHPLEDAPERCLCGAKLYGKWARATERVMVAARARGAEIRSQINVREQT